MCFSEFKTDSEAINLDLIVVIHPFEDFKIWSTPVDLLVNIISLKVVSEAKNSVF